MISSKNNFAKILILLLLINLQANTQPPSIVWQKSFGGSLYDKAESIIQTTEGNFVVAGHSQSNDYQLNNNFGGFDSWIIKINSTGTLIWKKSLGGSGCDYTQSVIETTDGGLLLVGESNSTNGDISNYFGQIDFWVVKLSENGIIEWKKKYGGDSNDEGYSACLTNDGNYIIAGSSESNIAGIETNQVYMDFWILKINPNGNIIWQKKYGGGGYEYLRKIKKTTDGGYILTGDTTSSDGNITGNNGGKDLWIVKIDENGNILWQNNFGGTLDDYSKDIIEDLEGNFIVVGETYSFDLDAAENHSNAGLRDYFVVKINNQGQKIWSRCYGGGNNEHARAIVQTSSGEYVIIGESYSSDGQPSNNHGSADFWLIKIKPSDGNLIWEKNFGGTGHDEPNSLIECFDNDFIIAGNAAHPIGNGDVTHNYGDDDFWILKVKNNECLKNLMLKKLIPFGNIEFEALENIISNVKILNSTSNIEYNSGKSIFLNPGFSTHTGSVFKAKIEGCSN